MLVNVVIAVLMKHLKETQENISANMAAKDLERKLRLLTISAKNTVGAKGNKSELSISRQRPIAQLGLGGIELAQLKHCVPEKAVDESFWAEFSKADAIFQEFLRLQASLHKVRMRVVRTASNVAVSSGRSQRRNSVCGIKENHNKTEQLTKTTSEPSLKELYGNQYYDN